MLCFLLKTWIEISVEYPGEKSQQSRVGPGPSHLEIFEELRERIIVLTTIDVSDLTEVDGWSNLRRKINLICLANVSASCEDCAK